jgi:5-methylcytosine-specific restriction endonuclease McrA
MIDHGIFVGGGRCCRCDNCGKDNGEVQVLHWEERDFDLCFECLEKLFLRWIRPDLIADEKVIVKRKAISEKLRNNIFKRDGGKCVSCGGNKLLEIDHIIPFSLGGKTEEGNLQLLCKDCNLEKRVKNE